MQIFPQLRINIHAHEEICQFPLFLQIQFAKLPIIIIKRRQVSMIKEQQGQLIKRVVIPLDLKKSQNITAFLNFHKPLNSAIEPARISTQLKRIKISTKNDSDKHDEFKRAREIKSYEIQVSSQKYKDSIFRTEIPFDVKMKEPGQLYFCMKVRENKGTLNILDCYSQMGERIIDKKGVTLTFAQRLKIQQSMLDNRTRRELTERDVMEEEDREEKQLFEDQDD